MPNIHPFILVVLLALFLAGTFLHGRDFFRGQRDAFLGFLLAGSLSAITATGLL
jgi:hypothetical protein